MSWLCGGASRSMAGAPGKRNSTGGSGRVVASTRTARGQVAERREQLRDAAGRVRDRLVQGVDDEQHRRRVTALVEPLQRIAQRAVEARLVA